MRNEVVHLDARSAKPDLAGERRARTQPPCLRVVLRPAHAATAAALLTAVNCMNIHVPGQGAKVQGQFQTDCKKAQEAALLCATTHPEERQRCDKFFAAYRECRKAEHSRILEARGQGR